MRFTGLREIKKELTIKITVSIKSLRPNNWYLNEDKVNQIRKLWEQEQQHTLALPLVTAIDGDLSLIDGHSRVFVAFENGLSEIEVQFMPLDMIEGSTTLYQHIHRKSPQMGVLSIDDLADRILSAEDHRELWVGYCENWLDQNMEKGT